MEEQEGEEWARGRSVLESSMQQTGCGPYEEVSQGLEVPLS